jgi:hypothetical protein
VEFTHSCLAGVLPNPLPDIIVPRVPQPEQKSAVSGALAKTRTTRDVKGVDVRSMPKLASGPPGREGARKSFSALVLLVFASIWPEKSVRSFCVGRLEMRDLIGTGFLE